MSTIQLQSAKGSQKWWVLGTVCFALFMINLDGNVMNLAMPSIIRDFGASLAQMEWISNAYMLTFAVFLITFGRLGDEVGRKLMFLIGLVLFTAGSALCGSARNVNELIAFRVIQGTGGSAMMPATLSLIAANFRKEERGRAMGFWGAVSGLAFIMGPIAGGYLTQSGMGPAINTLTGISQNWRYAFYVNLPIGLAALIIGLVVIPESKDSEKRHRLDIPGVILASLAIFLLTFGFIEGPRLGWWQARHDFALGGVVLNPAGVSIVPLLIGLALVFGAVFFLYERRRRVDPLVDLSLFRNHNYSIGLSIGVILNMALMGAMFLLPLFCQAVLGITPIGVGHAILPFAFALLVASPIAGLLSDRVDGKYLLVVGMVVLALSYLLMGHFHVDTKPAEMIIPFVVMGIGMGLSMTPLTNLTLFGVPEQRVGGASGVVSTARQIGAVMGVAAFSVILQSAMVGNVRDQLAHVANLPPVAARAVVNYVSDGGLSGTAGEGAENLQRQLAASFSTGAPASTAGAGSMSSVPSGDQAQGTVSAGLFQEVKAMTAGIELALKQGFAHSINLTFVVAAIINLLGALTTVLLRRTRRPRESPSAMSGCASIARSQSPN